MLPLHIAQDVRRQVLFYLQSIFDFRSLGQGEEGDGHKYVNNSRGMTTDAVLEWDTGTLVTK